jgi:peptidoglycan hydrolase CwlO-like protein
MIEPQLNQHEQAMGWRKRQMVVHQLEKLQELQELQERIQELESKLKHADTKIAKLEILNKEYKHTIKDMDRRIMRGLRD